ncbi:MAG: serine/threonine-protein phosphatase, partial [Phycisphaerae bacterium]|nr:serine/threonine-protein phosphatase [Phycisphaerae bacterium]
ILIADVSGHGAAAAVLMAVTHALAQLHPGAGCPPSELLGFLNNHLASKYTGDSGSFVTAFYGILDPARRQLVFASAGHPYPRIVRRGEVIAVTPHGGLPLGIEQNERYPEARIDLHPGDQLVLFTDGITEARNATDDLFGVERLDTLLGLSDRSAERRVESILTAVRAFADKRLDDDRTVVVLGV